MSINWPRAIVAGVLGSLAFSAVGIWVTPMLGLPRANPADMLAESLNGNMALAWVGHLAIGAVLAVIYAVVAARLPGPAAIRGALFSLAPWLLAQGMSMVAGPLETSMVLASLVGHLAYGLVMGASYGASSKRQAAVA